MKTTKLVLISIATIMMVACGGNSSKQTTDTQEVTEDVVNASPRSKVAAEHFIVGHGGINIADILPDWSYTTDPEDRNFYGDESKGVIRFNKPEGEELSKEDYIAWVRKVYAATKKISDDGINIQGFEGANDKAGALAEKPLEEMLEKAEGGFIYLGMYEWGYRYKDKFMRVYLDRTEKDGKYWAQIDIVNALTKSFDETMQDAEKALEDPNVQKAIKDALK